MTRVNGHQPNRAARAQDVFRRRILVRGVVQGVGFRPFVARLAADVGVAGHCGNDDVSVFIEAEGTAEQLEDFQRRLCAEAPPLSVIVDCESEHIAAQGEDSFRIVTSRGTGGARTMIPADVGTCGDCLAELNDPQDRRYRHPFITCTNCGPRFTIIEDLPYDRPHTTMAAFAMCSNCAAEYDDPSDRRFHAQPIACHDCGPQLRVQWPNSVGRQPISGDAAALEEVQLALRAGLIVAIKGIGGFHLACDATNPGAVDELRRRKSRPHKPFALMVADLEAAREIATVSDREAIALTQPARPIVLLSRRIEVAASVAPGLDELGILLPYAPIHHLLFTRVPGAAVEPPSLLVMTSGNLSDEPLCFTDDDALGRLANIADVFLLHNRKIAVPCEDSVVAVSVDGVELPVRRSRGFAPLPMILSEDGPITLAVGAEVKNTFCLARQDLAFCSAHVGDMGSLESQHAFETAVGQLVGLHRAPPGLVVADSHPGYATRAWAQRFSEATNVECVTVQHHHAHFAALLAEHNMLGRRVIGVVFDGTGYGTDATIWGGEFLLSGSDVSEVDRLGRLATFRLPGGDRAVRSPARVALSLLDAAGLGDTGDLSPAVALGSIERTVIQSQLRTGFGCVLSSSVGRLFDGVASILGVRHAVTYEAQAAIELEALARCADAPAPLSMSIRHLPPTEEGGAPLFELVIDELVADLVDGLRAGIPASQLALGFHEALANASAELAQVLCEDHRAEAVGLTGGVFQNRLLLSMMGERLREAELRVITHRRIPPNDGGLSLGQAVVGRAIAKKMMINNPDRRGG